MKPIRTQTDYEDACTRILHIMELSDEIEVLTILVRDYESRTTPDDVPSIVEAIRFRMKQQGLKQADLVPYFGSRSKVSEVLSGKRQLSLAMIRRLYRDLGIPAKVLLQEP